MREEDKQQIDIENRDDVKEANEKEWQQIANELRINKVEVKERSIQENNSENLIEKSKSPDNLSEHLGNKESYKINTINFFKDLPKENYLVNCYALPRGLTTSQRVRVMSESEKFYEERYSK